MKATETPLSVNERSLQRRAESKPTFFYRPELDVLRFLAFLAVFCCHSLQVGGQHPIFLAQSPIWRLYRTTLEAGNFGVCIFFLLSSYLITSLLHIERVKTGNIRLGSFYMRRILRIWPLYLSVIAFFVICGHFLPTLHIEPGQALAYVFVVGNWYLVAHPLAKFQLNWLWSISVEEQFYLAWPLIAKIGGMRLVSVLSILLVPISVLVVATMTENGQNLHGQVWLNSLVQFQFFALGALLALYLGAKERSFHRFSRLTMAFLGTACWLTASGVCRIKSPEVDPSVLAMCIGYELVALGTVLIFLSFLGVPSRYLPRFIIYLGKISYGLYVFHEIALSCTTAVRRLVESELSGSSILWAASVLLDRAGALALTITLAALSYRYLESPFLRMKQRFTLVRSRTG